MNNTVSVKTVHLKMKKIFVAFFMLSLMMFPGCSVLPEYPAENGGQTEVESTVLSSAESHESLQDVVDNAIADSKNKEKENMARIARYQVEVLTSRTPSDREVALAQEQIAKKKPLLTLSDDAISFCQREAEAAMSEFIADFSSSAYEDNETNRILKKMYSGDGSGILNGGIIPQQNGDNLEYWRIADCTYYNQFFFAPQSAGDDNMVKVVFRCNLYAYRLKEGAEVNNSELNNTNADIIEYKDSFIVVTLKNISELALSYVNAAPIDIAEEIVVYPEYDKAIKGFDAPPKGCDTLKVPAKCYPPELVDGFIGKPYVQMPDLIGHYIDISHPDSIAELDEVGIRYRVVWEDAEDATTPSYSIISTSVKAGTVVDITDLNATLIDVVVAR